jgi:hypothetical protein
VIVGPFRVPAELVLFTHRFWEKTGWYIPPAAWLLLVLIAFLAALLALSVSIRVWLGDRS